MRLVDLSSFPYAWLYYSSGVVFNKLIREKIKKRGYKLNEWGLFKDDKRIELENEKHETILEKELFDKNSILEYAEKIEKEIFKLAHLEYKTIPERY
jgi:DNA polymerase/3'-5' exonuclease PolX